MTEQVRTVLNCLEWIKSTLNPNLDVGDQSILDIERELTDDEPKESYDLASINVLFEDIVIGVATGLIASVMKDGIVEYIKNRSYYHSIIWEKYKSASEKTLPLIEKAISYVDNWIENIYQNKLPKKEDKK
jgi:hypothetical protein